MKKELIQYTEPIKNVLTATQKRELIEKTPSKYIMQRQGRGGKTFDYVQTGYVIQRLNEIFNMMWDFKILETDIMGGQVSVKGELTVHISPDFSITKTQYGSSDIKTDKNNKPLSIGDDKKSASSDALKKCASLLGIAADIYWGKEQVEDFYNDLDQKEKTLSENQMKRIYVLYKEKGLEVEEIKKTLYDRFNIESHKELTTEMAQEWIEYLLSLEDKK